MSQKKVLKTAYNSYNSSIKRYLDRQRCLFLLYTHVYTHHIVKPIVKPTDSWNKSGYSANLCWETLDPDIHVDAY